MMQIGPFARLLELVAHSGVSPSQIRDLPDEAQIALLKRAYLHRTFRPGVSLPSLGGVKSLEQGVPEPARPIYAQSRRPR